MTAVPTTSTPTRRVSLLGRLTAGALLATVLTLVAIAVWPASAADKAHDDGKALGQAYTKLYSAENKSDVNAALSEIRTAARDTRIHAGDAVAAQVADQQEALSRAVEGFVGSNTSDDDFEAALYETELEVALDDISRQDEDFRAEGPEVQQAFWEGFDEGLAGF